MLDSKFSAAFLAIQETEEFRKLYLCEPRFHDALDELAVEYHERCERFDRLVCSGPVIDGSIIPVTRRERYLVSRNASAVRAEILSRAAVLGYSRAQVLKAIGRHA